MEKKVDVCVIGAGYVGLVTGACLAYLDNNVTVVDANVSRVEDLKKGRIPFFEPGLGQLVENTVQNKLLEFTTDLASAVKKSQIIFIAVGTPPMPNGEPDLSQVINVACQIGNALDTNHKRVVVNKSTVPVGSGNWVEMLVKQGINQNEKNKSLVPVAARPSDRPSLDELPAFAVISNPEFLREGSAIEDTLYPDRIVIGGNDESCITAMRDLYRPILEQKFQTPAFLKELKTNFEQNEQRTQCEIPFVVTDLASAELIKYAANAFLAMKISFANEIAGLCEKAGADIREVTKGIGLDKRIGRHFLNAGIGWGGSCFGKDVRALIESAKEYNYPTPLLESTIAVNERQRKILIGKLQEELKILKGRTVGLMGLSFKPNTDDLRDAPSLTIIQHLLKMGARVKAYDPVSISSCAQQYPDLNVMYCQNLADLAEDCDALLLLTEWPEFQTADWPSIAQAMRSPLIIDGRNVLPKQEILAAGISYRGVGH